MRPPAKRLPAERWVMGSNPIPSAIKQGIHFIDVNIGIFQQTLRFGLELRTQIIEFSSCIWYPDGPLKRGLSCI